MVRAEGRDALRRGVVVFVVGGGIFGVRQGDAPRFGEPVAPGGDGERGVFVGQRFDEPDVPADVGVPAQRRE